MEPLLDDKGDQVTVKQYMYRVTLRGAPSNPLRVLAGLPLISRLGFRTSFDYSEADPSNWGISLAAMELDATRHLSEVFSDAAPMVRKADIRSPHEMRTVLR